MSESLNTRTQKAIDSAESTGISTGRWVGSLIGKASRGLFATGCVAFCGAITFLGAAGAGVIEGIKGGNNEGASSKRS